LEKNAVRHGYLATYILVDHTKARELRKGRLKVILRVPLKNKATKIMSKIKEF